MHIDILPAFFLRVSIWIILFLIDESILIGNLSVVAGGFYRKDFSPTTKFGTHYDMYADSSVFFER